MDLVRLNYATSPLAMPTPRPGHTDCAIPRCGWFIAGVVRDWLLFCGREVHLLSIEKEVIMLKWALIFFIISIVAGLFGFTGIAAGSAAIAKLLFGIALILFLIFLILGLTIYRKIEK